MNEKIFNKYNKVMQKVFEEKMDDVTTRKDYFFLISTAREKFETELIDGLSIEKVLRKEIEKEGIDNVLDIALMICDMYLPYTLVSIIHEIIGVEALKKGYWMKLVSV